MNLTLSALLVPSCVWERHREWLITWLVLVLKLGPSAFAINRLLMNFRYTLPWVSDAHMCVLNTFEIINPAVRLPLFPIT